MFSLWLSRQRVDGLISWYMRQSIYPSCQKIVSGLRMPCAAGAVVLAWAIWFKAPKISWQHLPCFVAAGAFGPITTAKRELGESFCSASLISSARPDWLHRHWRLRSAQVFLPSAGENGQPKLGCPVAVAERLCALYNHLQADPRLGENFQYFGRSASPEESVNPDAKPDFRLGAHNLTSKGPPQNAEGGYRWFSRVRSFSAKRSSLQASVCRSPA